MKARHSLLATIAVMAFLAPATSSLAEEIKKAPKPVKASAKAEDVSKEVALSETEKVWRRTKDHPCDSTACRPARFPWSPVAPGA